MPSESEVKAHAANGDLNYFVELKATLGEDGFRRFMKNGDYKTTTPRSAVLPTFPVNKYLKAALTHHQYEAAKFLLLNGVSKYQTTLYNQLNLSREVHKLPQYVNYPPLRLMS